MQGNRDQIDSMAPGSQKVLTQVLKLIDSYDLYGSVAYPKHHTQKDISDIYLFSAATRGIFTNVALQVGQYNTRWVLDCLNTARGLKRRCQLPHNTVIPGQEPFGLTVIEAAAHGVPTVATQNGGPVDIMATLHHGVTVNPTDTGVWCGRDCWLQSRFWHFVNVASL